MKPPMTILVPFLFSLLLSVSTANVTQNATFRFVNEGFFDEYMDIEYGATYRSSSEPKLFASPFVVCFYNTTPGVYTLALRMGGSFHRRTTLLWVWEANRGKPVGENAVFALRNDGNLVLTHADGRLAWQTNTANKGVTGFKLLSNGNMVLHDANGKFVWQSFDFPTDTLLVGQSLNVGPGNGTNKLVSRLSDKENKDGPYTLAVETKGSMSLYFSTGPNKKSSLLYYASADFSDMDETVVFDFQLDAEAGAYFFTLGPYVTARAYHNSSLSFLRLGIDGNLRIFTYNEGIERRAFITAYAFFARDIPRVENECQLPGRCGGFGVCEDSQCVACPSDSGQLLGWSRTCQPPRLTAGSGGGCKAGGSLTRYYKLEGVDHFLSKYAKGEEGIGERKCGNKCSLDCKCAGYFYHREISTCWLTPELGTLTRAPNSTHVGYIKTRA